MALSRGLADTSIFIAREAERPILEDSLPEELAVSVITVGELRAGVLAATDTPTRDRRLSTLEAALALQPVPVDDRVASAWARLRIVLRDQGPSMPVNDSWIAATAMALDVPVVTQDHDFPLVDELDVVHV
ncbi:MAG: type II toxin-antitoxin system VapC family toxin [Acidimicrobiaceae bacterium]|nr:type II toxin-antitoxin system VapC family toxin [Acidimicrobiaceae bacterium]MXZ99615.1 type II toxin-antitoxin system VapC family toxin [Acidimicrobiaceae bacterium]MYE75508.1 type II toxin-antitoxin system VapC family toxin [Acidimicrobiaceae bacterium]MYE97874.1 type II toxin-antitoxin system VapC family toxin [Acidimicrobiaceae bacterium]MYH44297.1 type II toxin-antitoxin system VapC family toxin [Acidimicrobiaceae bacterium]